MRSTCWKLKSCASLKDFTSVSWVKPSHEIPAKLSTQRIFKCNFLTFHSYYIYPHSKRKTLGRFSTTHTPIFQRESYSSLVRNHSSLFSFPLPLSYLEKKFLPRHNPHIFRVQRVFWSLGSFRDLPKEASEAWQMQSGILQDPKNQRRHDSEKSVDSRSLEGSSTLGRLGLEGLLLFVYSNFILQWIDYRLEGGKKVFRRVLCFPL